MNAKVDAYFRKAKTWPDEMKKLREILLTCPLTEDLKWGKPCYVFEGHNIVLIIPMKNHCVLLFCKGALVKDPKGILVKAGEHTQEARQARFTSLAEIIKLEPTLKAYLREAIEVEKLGLKLESKPQLLIPEEFQNKLNASPALKKAFEALTPGRKRAYGMFFSGAKQSQTRESRIEKWIPAILQGKGMNDAE